MASASPPSRGTRQVARPVSHARAVRYREQEELIIEAAYRQLRSGGISVTELLRDTGVSTRAFYKLFDSREALILVLCRREFVKMNTRLAAAVATAGSPVAAMRAWIGEYLLAAYDDRRALRTRVFHSGDARAVPGFKQVNKEGMAAARGVLAAAIRAGRDDGQFPHAQPELHAQAIQEWAASFVEARVEGEAGPSFDEALDLIADTFCRAFGAEVPG